MTDAMLLLRLDHSHFDELLKLVEQQLDQDDPVDLKLLRSIVEYFSDYPDQCHHPVEDLVFHKLRLRDLNRAESVKRLLQDHKSIAESTKQFSDTVDEAANDENVQNMKLRDVMRQFVDKYRAHMVAEEKDFFPFAKELLDRNDWAEIDYVLFDRIDPLFDREAHGQFRELSNKIDLLAKKSYMRGSAIREAKALRELASIRAFNEMMRKAGHDYRLIEHPEGAYGIEHRGEVIMDIPKCNATRAIWCAYFYVQGNGITSRL